MYMYIFNREAACTFVAKVNSKLLGLSSFFFFSENVYYLYKILNFNKF